MNAQKAHTIATDSNVEDMENLFESIKEKAEEGEFKLNYLVGSSKLSDYKYNMLVNNGYTVSKLHGDNLSSEYEISWGQDAN